MAGQRVGGLAWGVLTSCLFLATAVPAMELAKSQPLARDEDKAAVEKWAGALHLRQDEARWLFQAEVARAEGLMSQAAAAYEQAWLSGRNHPEAAFKAADLYAQNLGQPVTAARLLRQMRRGPTSTVVAEQAQLALDKLAPTLREVAVQHVRIAATQHGAEALQS
ncbi:hypothetical protein, partial [Leptothrix ochracea]|uniref:hypothetical protein n=1 Tax=Leptothrix ochracea TaxID=735331 RepID=UPI0034E2590E